MLRFNLFRRSLHVAPTLPGQAALKSAGIPGLYSAKGFNIAWTEYQDFLTTNLTLCTNGSKDETRYPLHIAINNARDPHRQRVFNYASQAHNNHFFFQQLVPHAQGSTSPSRQLQAKINASFGSTDELRAQLVAASGSLIGQGWLFVVEDAFKNLQVIAINNSGTPYNFSGQQLLDFNSPISQQDYEIYEKIREKTNNSETDYTLPIIGISLWDQSYLHDFGVEGKAEYVGKVFDSLNWDVINSRVYSN